jgi:hypothetical protein
VDFLGQDLPIPGQSPGHGNPFSTDQSYKAGPKKYIVSNQRAQEGEALIETLGQIPLLKHEKKLCCVHTRKRPPLWSETLVHIENCTQDYNSIEIDDWDSSRDDSTQIAGQNCLDHVPQRSPPPPPLPRDLPSPARGSNLLLHQRRGGQVGLLCVVGSGRRRCRGDRESSVLPGSCVVVTLTHPERHLPVLL